MSRLLGVGFAFAAAASLGLQALSIRLGGARGGRSIDALLVVVAVNLVVLVPATLLRVHPNYGLTVTAVLGFVASGVAGTLLGRALLFEGIKRVGASRAEPIKASMPLHAAVIAILVLGERPTFGHLLGIVLVVAGVAIVSLEHASRDDQGEVGSVTGLAFPLAAAVSFGFEPTFAKIGLNEGTPVLVGLTLKAVTAFLGFAGYALYARQTPTVADLRNATVADLRNGSARWYLLAGLFSTTFLLTYFSALAVAPVVLVAPFIQLSPLVVLAVSVLFLRQLEPVTWRLTAGATLLVVGAVAITVLQ